MVAMELASVGEGTKFDMTATVEYQKNRLDLLGLDLVRPSGRLRTSSGAIDSAGSGRSTY